MNSYNSGFDSNASLGGERIRVISDSLSISFNPLALGLGLRDLLILYNAQLVRDFLNQTLCSHIQQQANLPSLRHFLAHSWTTTYRETVAPAQFVVEQLAQQLGNRIRLRPFCQV